VIVAIALVLAGAIAFVLLRRDGGSKGAKVPAVASGSGAGRVSVERYRASYRQRLEAARQVVARRRAAPQGMGRDAAAKDDAARLAAKTMMMREMMEPQCILGPGELCATLDEAVADCATDDGRACLAIGQYLADTPPRPLVALVFFLHACNAGDEEGCRRMKEVKEPTDAPCADDVFRCGWLAHRSRDPARLDEACREGVADACSWLITWADDANDEQQSRTYLEHACQLGSPMACQELGRRLTPGCTPERPLADDGQTPMYFPCYPPDADQAAEARTIACEAGFADACD
jgi:TPR repeat protein